tara:strand:- start:575 stop:1486 length:912 start_codon:yes stop_codon:yes gene_type:complete
MQIESDYKTCPKCGYRKKPNQFARHVHTCKGVGPPGGAVKVSTILCTFCNKYYQKKNFKRHSASCKFRKSVVLDKLKEALEISKNEIKYLRTYNCVLANEKAELACDKAKLAVQLIETKDRLARRELEFTKQLATRLKPAIHNHHYHQYAVHMTPWCIDPTDPSYERFLADDVTEMQLAMASLPTCSHINQVYKTERDNARNKQYLFSEIVKRRLGDSNPRYIVPDISRHKGMFLMPDGSVRVDPGLSMMLQHQFMVGLGTANNICDWWFHEPMARKQFHRMITQFAGNAAVRLKQLKSPPVA